MYLFPSHRQPSSQVPYESPNKSHAFYTPDTAWPVGRFPPRFSQSRVRTPVLMSSGFLSMPHQRFTFVRLSYSYLTQSVPRLLTMTFTTAVFGRSSSWRFEAFPCRLAPKGLPSSLVQHDAFSIFLTQSPVPRKSLYHAPVACTPTAIRPVIRFPPDLSQLWLKPLVLTAFSSLTTLRRLFTFVQLHGTYLTDYPSLFSFAFSTTTFGCSTQRRFGIHT